MCGVAYASRYSVSFSSLDLKLPGWVSVVLVDRRPVADAGSAVWRSDHALD